MSTAASAIAVSKGRLLLRDGVTFLVLSCIAVALFGVTLFLFNSFEERREDLGKRWTERGQVALSKGDTTYAIQALHTALSYEPNSRDAQINLAEALAATGQTDEATNYFLNLWEARPGDGFINYQLAKLARKRGDSTETVNYYRAAIFGSWLGDGSTRRREVRLELADYFASRGNTAAARAELLIAAGNAPQSQYLEVSLGDRLQAIGDSRDALQLYKKALQADPNRRSALEKAGRAAYALGDYATAYTLLTRATDQLSGPAASSDEAAAIALAANARRVQQLSLSRDLSSVERTDHILLAAGIAQKRLAACDAQLATTPTVPQTASPLQPLRQRWTASTKYLNRRTVERDASLQDRFTDLISDTESQSEKLCGSPAGDDALLLMLTSGTHGVATR